MSHNLNIPRHTFQPGAMSIIQMGEELIGHPTTAVNELVKNGYDADATSCYVYVHIADKGSFVSIFDNGLGMEYDTLFGAWLHPSISSKRLPGAKSEFFKRSFLGSKGIGRLAAMALGKTLTVISKKIEEKEYNWLSLKSDLFRTDKLLNQVDFPGDKVKSYFDLFVENGYLKERGSKENSELLKLLKTKFKDFNEGTLVVVEDVDLSLKTIFKQEFEDQNENEDETTLADTSIYRGLSVLITPLKLSTDIQNELLQKKIISKQKQIAQADSTFDIFFGSNIVEGLRQFEFLEVKPISLLQKYDYRLIGKATKDGFIHAKYECQRLVEDSYAEPFSLSQEQVFTKEYKKLKNKKKPKELSEQEWNADAGEFYFDFRIYDRGEEDSKKRLESLVNSISKGQRKKVIDNLLGMRISKNGFGVKPYGEEGAKDWLDLSQIRVQNPGQNLSINQILGYVFYYSPENDGLKEKTNREGFYENKAFIDSKEILRVIIKNIGQLRYNYRLRHNLGRVPQNKLQRPDTQLFLEFLKENQDAKKLVKRTEEFVEEITTALENMEDTLSFSQRLASLGTGLELVYHELAQPIAKIGGSRAILKQRSSKVLDIEIRESLIKEISLVGSYVAQLDELKGSLKPAIGKSREQIFKPNDTFKKVCFLFKKDLQEFDIEVESQKGADQFEIEDYEYAFWVSFLNIINNAVYWLRLNKSSSRKISYLFEGKSIVIQNNGPKIPDDSIDLIFEYGYTLKKEKNATGLGLAFSKNILNLNNWEIFAENRQSGPAFIITKSEENG